MSLTVAFPKRRPTQLSGDRVSLVTTQTARDSMVVGTRTMLGRPTCLVLPTISHPSPDELLPALQMIFGSRSDAGRSEPYRAAISSGGRDPHGLFVARDGSGQLCGAILAQPLRGSLGVIWPPRAETAEVEDSLVAAASEWLRDGGVRACQAFATPEELSGLAPLARNGFRRTTELVSLYRQLSPEVVLPEPKHPIIFVPESPPFSYEFRTALAATHERSMDCPELIGGRTEDELVAGFSVWTPGNEWFLAVDRDLVLGVVVFASGAEPEIMELSYLGVVPLLRRGGFGGELLDFAIAAATLSRVSGLVAAVDARNEPALRLFRTCGFVETARHEVFLADWPTRVRPDGLNPIPVADDPPQSSHFHHSRRLLRPEV